MNPQLVLEVVRVNRIEGVLGAHTHRRSLQLAAAPIMLAKLYGVPLSQPFRSIAWAFLQKKVPFEVVLTVPGSTAKMGSRAEPFLTKNPFGTVPLYEEPDTGFALAESASILSYLGEKHSWDLYPASTKDRARMSSYMHWHHTGTRGPITGLFQPFVRPDLGIPSLEQMQARETRAKQALALIDTVWLGGTGSNFVGGLASASVADLLAYEEVAQLLPEYCNLGVDLAPYPNVLRWVDRMKALPEYEAAHVALASLGALRVETDVPMTKRLGEATKAALKAITKAQTEY